MMGYSAADFRVYIDVLGPCILTSGRILYNIHLYLVWDTQAEGMPWHRARPPNKTCLLYLRYALVHNQAPKGEGISWCVWLLMLCRLVYDQSSAGECKGCNGCVLCSTACNTVLHSTAPMCAATQCHNRYNIYLALC